MGRLGGLVLVVVRVEHQRQHDREDHDQREESADDPEENLEGLGHGWEKSLGFLGPGGAQCKLC